MILAKGEVLSEYSYETNYSDITSCQRIVHHPGDVRKKIDGRLITKVGNFGFYGCKIDSVDHICMLQKIQLHVLSKEAILYFPTAF